MTEMENHRTISWLGGRDCRLAVRFERLTVVVDDAADPTREIRAGRRARSRTTATLNVHAERRHQKSPDVHERGETSCLEMSTGLADNGIERWTVDTEAMTITFSDRSGAVLMVDQIT
jgi:hypothetical protein